MKRFLIACLGLLISNLASASDLTQKNDGDSLANTLFYGAQVGSNPINRKFKLNTSLFNLNANIIGLQLPWSITQGGTGVTAAGGTALDAISGLSGTGILRRTGAGAYSFLPSPSSALVGVDDVQTFTHKTIDCLAAGMTCTNFPGGGGGGGVTSLTTGTGLTGGPITGTGTVAVLAHGITPALMEQRVGNSVLGVAGASTADVAAMLIPDCPDTNGNHLNKASGLAFGCGNSSRPASVYSGGVTTNAGNDYTIASPIPSSPAFALTDQNRIHAKINVGNTGASRLNVAGTGLTAIQVWTGAGYAALKNGELQASYEADFVYSSTCSCFVFLNPATGQISIGAVTGTITAAQWAAGTELDPTAASQTFTAPATSTLTPQGGVIINALNFSTALQANGADTITAGGVTTAAGATATIPLGTLAKAATDGAGHIYLSPGKLVGGVLVTDVTAGGTGQTTYTNCQLLTGGSAGGLTPQVLIAGSNMTVTCGGAGNNQITLAASGGGGGAAVNAPQGRLTCTSGTPVMIADVTACTTIYYDNYIGNQYPFYTGAADSTGTITAGEMSDALPNSGTGVVNSGDLFDEWAINGFICHATNGAGGGWSSDTAGSTSARGTGYTQVDFTSRPYLTNKNAIAHCYAGATDKGSVGANQATLLGTFYTTAAGTTKMQFAAAAAAGGSNAFLGLGNAYNVVRVVSRSIDNTGTASTYASATWRSMRNSASNRITVVDPLGRSSVTLLGDVNFTGNGGSACTYSAGFNRNSTSATPDINAAIFTSTAAATSFALKPQANFQPAIGLSYYQMMESVPFNACDSGGTPTISATVGGM